jgi:hypothetical protein
MATIDLYWIPLGARQHVVRASGKTFEALSALVHRRRRSDLYHSALAVTIPDGRFVIEMTPVPDYNGEGRGVVVEGAVGSRLLGRFRLFRYEIRRWLDGIIPDASEATSSVRLHVEPGIARCLLDLVRRYPPQCGAVTSSTPVRCGTRTPSPRGGSHAAEWTRRTSARLATDAHPVGALASPSRDGIRVVFLLADGEV